MHKHLERQLAKAIASQAKYYNFKHVACEYNVGNWVYLNSINIHSTCATKKLYWKFYGPYKIIDCVGKVAYRFDLHLHSWKLERTVQ